ncbi:MAG: AAA family ATPase [Hungatella sp.]|nr:AAA family ATPase [Hungatella sp.]
MGIYVNPGNTLFKQAVNSMVYVDKSELISYTNRVLNTQQKNICVSRPRRFGKSMAADMLVAYYSKGCESGELFAGKKAEKLESYRRYLNQRNVIRLDIQRFLESERDLDSFIVEIEKAVVEELIEEYPNVNRIDASGRLKTALSRIFNQTGEGFVFIIDEWDCVFRFAKKRQDVQKEYLDFLRGLFKGAEYVDLAYMTGILPIKKYGEHSAINIFKEFSMLNPGRFVEYFGFTEEEVMWLCEKYNVDYGETRAWYDGYLLGGIHIYNPQAVTELMENGDFRSYWTGTETYEALKVYIDLNFDGLKEAVIGMLSNVRCKIDPSTCQNDMTTFKTRDDVLTLLIHLGYLSFDEKNSEAFIPNQEIAQEFLRSVKTGGWEGLMQALNRSDELLHSTWEMNGETVAEGLSAIHSETASMLKYHDENSLTCTILMAYYSAKTYYMNPVMELPSGKGFADVVYLPRRNVDKPALVVELKWNRSASGAIAQIKDRKYASWIQGYTGEILLVGINYDRKKGHECVIERYVKE